MASAERGIICQRTALVNSQVAWRFRAVSRVRTAQTCYMSGTTQTWMLNSAYGKDGPHHIVLERPQQASEVLRIPRSDLLIG